MDAKENLLKQADCMEDQDRDEYIDFFRRLFDVSDNFKRQPKWDGVRKASSEKFNNLKKELICAIIELSEPEAYEILHLKE